MSKTRSALTKPVYKPRTWGRPSRPRALKQPWLGLDTERDSVSGDFVCGFVANANNSAPFTLLYDLAPGTYWAWNLAYDIEGMVRDLKMEDGWAMRVDGARFKLGDGSACYYHGKRFEYNDATGTRLFVDASPFYNKQSLADAAGSEIGERKDAVDASKMSLQRYREEAKYREVVDKYCIQDSRLVWKLVDKLNTGLQSLPNPVSMGGTPGATARRFLSKLPPFPDVVWDTLRPFLSAYCGGRFEMLKRGYFPRGVEYDLVSAYPWALSECPLLTHSAESYFTTRANPDALYGAYQVRSYSDEYMGLLPSWKGSTRVYSRGEEKAWVCKPELDLMHRLGVDYEILKGSEITDPNATMGFAPDMHELFSLKKTRKGYPEASGAKVILNSVYGCLIQLIPKGGVWVPVDEAGEEAIDFVGDQALVPGEAAFEGGQYLAPCYASTLTSKIRVRLVEGAMKIGLDNVIATHTDSLICRGGSLPTSDEMGAWEKKEEVGEKDGGVVIFKTGQYGIGAKVKGRGFVKRRLEPWNLDEVPKRQKVDLWADRQPTRSRTGIKTAKTWGEVSVIRDGTHANNLDWESKRKWFGEASARLVERQEWQDSEALQDVMAG